MKPKKLHKYVKDGLARKIKAAAKEGRFVLYRELAEFAFQQWDKEFPKNDRRCLVDYLDAINHDSCREGKDVLLSIIVVNDDGMPDSGFFRKLKLGKWKMDPLQIRSIEHERDEKIFRREAAKVFRAYAERVGVLVFIDLQSVPPDGRDNALNWLGNHANVRGYAYGLPEHKKKLRALRNNQIHKRDVVDSGKDAVDAALLVEFGREAFRIPESDFVCIMGSDAIYKQATELALKNGVKVLCFCKRDMMNWSLETDGFYRVFDIAAPVEEWDANMDWSDNG